MNQRRSTSNTLKFVEVSEKTSRFLRKKYTQRVPNAEKKQLQDCYLLPKVPATRAPKLDPFMRP